MAEPALAELPSRRLSERQLEALDGLLVAAEAEVEAGGYDGLTIRGAAKAAGISPASAYTYVSSKDHLLAELLWRRIRDVEEPDLAGSSVPERLARTVEGLSAITEGSVEVVAACTQALLSSNPDVAELRARIGAEIHRRIAAAAPGSGTVADVLVTTYFGALLSAGMGHMAYEEVPGFVVEAARLMGAAGAGR